MINLLSKHNEKSVVMESNSGKTKTILFTTIIIFAVITIGKFIFYGTVGEWVKGLLGV